MTSSDSPRGEFVVEFMIRGFASNMDFPFDDVGIEQKQKRGTGRKISKFDENFLYLHFVRWISRRGEQKETDQVVISGNSHVEHAVVSTEIGTRCNERTFRMIFSKRTTFN